MEIKIRASVIATRVLNFDTRKDDGCLDHVEGLKVYFTREPSTREADDGWTGAIPDSCFITQRIRQKFPAFLKLPQLVDMVYEPEGTKLRLVAIREIKVGE